MRGTALRGREVRMAPAFGELRQALRGEPGALKAKTRKGGMRSFGGLNRRTESKACCRSMLIGRGWAVAVQLIT